MTVGVVGLGLIGGSIAKAIKYNTDNKVIGFDIDENVVLKARLLGAIDEEMTEQKISECDNNHRTLSRGYEKVHYR